ncbi:MFS general substrate transporter [Amniculicola lignicola CBS 123094]|uniref:MFS general substrate transporter n=1 Tax=Amniculicola lignicola CBS 123094 TaxID=1392246 RepID=A0A6A5WZP0_9PLEO|nr:MFS general substrate transporter [Amniculicola lignicola CBS 123094]
MDPTAGISSRSDANPDHSHQQPSPPPISGLAEPAVGPDPRPQNPGEQRPSQNRRLTRRRRGSRLGFPDFYGEAERHEFLWEKKERLKYITNQLDKKGFDWGVFLVAASGFLTDSYLLFVTNTVIPSIIYVYMYDKPREAADFEFWINVLTLMGSIVGQVLFGLLADLLGRTSLYGWELIIVILSTLGFAFTSRGVTSTSTTGLVAPSLDLKTSFYCWRFIQGVGIGAEYPLSSVLTAEWASVGQRARMLAALFAMQPLGQLFAALAGLSAVSIIDTEYQLADKIRGKGSNYGDYSRAVVDRVWRNIVLFGLIPSIIALIFRFYLTDPGRYTLEVQEDIDRAVEDTDRQISRNWYWPWKKVWPWRTNSATPSQDVELQQPQRRNQGTGATADTSSSDPPRPLDPKQSFSDLWNYLIKERNITLLFGTCATWFLLDVAFYGLGISSPHMLAVVWANKQAPSVEGGELEPWNPDPTHPKDTIVDVLRSNSKELILTSALGALLGSIGLIICIDWFRRKRFLQWSFLVLSGFLLATALSMRYNFATGRWRVTFAFYMICQILFNFGPNTLTFIIPAEIFPTRYRCLFHGLSAASGKLGSVVVRIALHSLIKRDNTPDEFNNRAKKLMWVMIFFAFTIMSGFLVTKIFIPDVQDSIGRGKDRRLVSKTLEVLAPGLSGPGMERQSLGLRWFKDHWPTWLRHTRRRDSQRAGPPSDASPEQIQPTRSSFESHSTDGPTNRGHRLGPGSASQIST